jgi:hypothetical protein
VHHSQPAAVVVSGDMAATVSEERDSQPIVVTNYSDFDSDTEFDDTFPDKAVSRLNGGMDQSVHLSVVFFNDARV